MTEVIVPNDGCGHADKVRGTACPCIDIVAAEVVGRCEEVHGPVLLDGPVDGGGDGGDGGEEEEEEEEEEEGGVGLP